MSDLLAEVGPVGAEPPAGRAESSESAASVVTERLDYCELLRALQGALLFGFGLFLLYRMAAPISTLLLLFLLVFILAAVFNPLVVWLHRRGVPRIASAAGLAVLIVGGIALLVWLTLPPLAREVGDLFQNLPAKQQRLVAYYQTLEQRFPGIAGQLPSPQELAKSVGPHVARTASQVGRYTMNLATVVISLVLLVVLVVFTLANPTPLVTGLLAAAPKEAEGRVERALRRTLEQLKNWAAGSLKLGLIVGAMTAVGLWIVGKASGHPVPYILLFSIIAALGELIPNIGPLVSAVPPILIAFTIDPMLGVWVALLFLLIQQTENNLIVPLVMGKSLDLHPVSLIFTVLVMGSLFGLLGAILAVPVAAIFKVCWEEFYLIPRGRNVEALQQSANRIIENQAQEEDANQVPGQSQVAENRGTRRPNPPRRRSAAS